MGLDVYVGPLCRYYSGAWKSSVQQAAEAMGVEFRLFLAHPPPADAIRDPLEARPFVIEWREAVMRALGPRVPALDWPEDPAGGYFTDKPDWDGYLSLKILAASDEFPGVPLPKYAGDFEVDGYNPYRDHIRQVYEGLPPRASLFGLRRGRQVDVAGPPRYAHVMLPQLWLPADFVEPFAADDPAGNPTVIGSLPAMLRELEGLNSRTLKLTSQGLAAARDRGLLASESDSPPLEIAPAGLSIFLEACRYGVQHRQPMKLDS